MTMTASNIRQSLRLDVQGSETARKAGETIERRITIKNQGQQTAKIDVWITSIDAKADLRTWAEWSETLPIVLSAHTDRELTLKLKIPVTAQPGSYHYEIHAESFAYPGEIPPRSQYIEVLPSERYLEDRNQPAFLVQPSTSSESPHIVKMGQSIDVEIAVENRSKQVDYVSVSCPELKNWLQSDPHPLELLPEQSGKVTLKLQPPKDAIAGNYSSTLRLTSAVSNLTFLEIFYLNLEIDDRVLLSLIDEPLPPNTDKRFTVCIANPGNIERPLEVVPQDGAKLFRYHYTTAQLAGASENITFPLAPRSLFNLRSRHCDYVQLSLAPYEELYLHLTPKLTLKPWRRLWFGRDREVPFQVELRNSESSEALFLPEPEIGTLRWQPYPRWLIGLLLLIPALILLKILLSLGYWGLWNFVVKPSLMPKIAEFSTSEKNYQEEVNTPIKLSWEIQNSGLLGEFKLSQNNIPQPPLVVDYSQQQSVLPKECQEMSIAVKGSWLRSAWEMLYQDLPEMKAYTAKKGTILRCNGFEIGSAKSTGSYTFKLETTSRKLQPTSDTPIGNAIAEFSKPITQPLEAIQEFINNPFDIKNIPPRSTLTDVKILQDIQVAKPMPSAIVDFSTTISTYRETSSTPGQSSQNSAKLPAPPVLLSWTIRNPNQLESLDLSWTQTSYDGKISKSPRAISFKLDTLKEDPRCPSQGQLLVCQNIPVPVDRAGQYIFVLTSISKNSSSSSTKTLQNIQIRPPLPQITLFSVNGSNAIEKPKQVIVLNPAIGSMDVTLTWDVPDRDRMKIELLPAPGLIDPSRSSTLTYSLSPKSNTAMMLRVTNQAGESIEQSVVIETTEYVPPERAVIPSSPPLPAPPPPPDGATPSSSPTKPPEGTQDLPPYELPPKTN